MPTKSDCQFRFAYPETPGHRKFVEKFKTYQQNGQVRNIPEQALPFQNFGLRDLGFWQYLELAFGAVFLLIPRCFVFVLTAIGVIVFGKIGLIGLGSDALENEPCIAKSRWRKVFSRLAYFCVRAHATLCYGLWWADHKGTPRMDIPLWLLVPHSSLMDTFPWFSICPLGRLVSFIIKAENPVVAQMPLQIFMALRVTRASSTDKNFITNEIKRRAENIDQGWWPIILAPEATALSGTVLHKFKLGAFKPGLPVQPVRITTGTKGPNSDGSLGRQSVNLCDLDGASEISFIKIVIYHMCKIYHPLGIEYLDPIYPDEKEKIDPILYADNCREKISKSLKLPLHDSTFEDNILMSRFLNKFGGNPNYGFCKYVKLQVLYHVNYSVICPIFDWYLNQVTVQRQDFDPETAYFSKAKFFEIFEEDLRFSTFLSDAKFVENFGDVEKDLGEKLELSDAIELLVYAYKFTDFDTSLRKFVDGKIAEKRAQENAALKA